MLLSLFSCTESPQQLSTVSGVSLELAKIRKQQVSEVTYQLAFSVPLNLEDSISSELNLTLSIHNTDHPLYLDFAPNRAGTISLLVNDQSIPGTLEKEHLVIPAEHLKLGQNSIQVRFIAGELSLNRNHDYLYTLLVPARARTLFPCFDQPDIKANYLLNITAPTNWKVLAGAPLDYQKEYGAYREHQFKLSDKMSTYLFSFVAGDFKQIDTKLDHFPINLLYRETDSLKINNSITQIFDLHQQSLDFLEEYTAYSFPYQKMDMAAIPGYQYGGMEHVGAIQYRESSLFLDSSATLSQKLNRAKLIAHETSHMWFGNLVTMNWFDDVWLKEVFANLMADKIINPVFSEVDHQLQFMTAHYPAAYGVDRTLGSHPIRQPLNNLQDAGSLYGSIIYHKAPIMMRQLEATLGEDNFRNGMRTYIKKFAHDNATWDDLIAILDLETEVDLVQWSKVWVNSAGRPVIEGQLTFNDDDKIQSMELHQRDEDGSDKVWPQLFEVSFIYPDSTVDVEVNSHQSISQVPQAEGLPKPDLVVYNSNGLGYGVFPIDINKLNSISDIDNEVARGYSYLNCFESTLNGVIPAQKAFELFMADIKVESNELILRQITNMVSTLYWKYLTNSLQQEYLPELLTNLYRRLQSSELPNIKKDLFRLYKSLATTEESREILYQIWKKELVIPNLGLSQNDYTDIAMHLALFRHPQTENILTTAGKEIKNPDRLARFEFLRPALAEDEATRAAYFQSFSQEENRAKESWVVSACYFIHHPLRQQSAINDLKLALELLEEIRQTGDIFFPKAWLDNTIGMYNSEKAMHILEQFLDSHPQLNAQLKLKLWQSADHLRRVQKLSTASDL